MRCDATNEGKCIPLVGISDLLGGCCLLDLEDGIWRGGVVSIAATPVASAGAGYRTRTVVGWWSGGHVGKLGWKKIASNSVVHYYRF